jgi:hypothetical protein
VREEAFSPRPKPARARLLQKGQSWRLVGCALALAILATAGLEVPFTLGQAEAAIDGIEAEEAVHEERRTQAGQRRIAEDLRSDLSGLARVADTDVETALAAYAAAQLERGTGRHRRYRHKSLLL